MWILERGYRVDEWTNGGGETGICKLGRGMMDIPGGCVCRVSSKK